MPNQEITNKDRLIKLENDIVSLRGDIVKLMELVKQVIEQTKKEEPSGWIFS
jgi:hypothetical protein|tara:strand:- start:1938 stop:2093 length:156 start_codon:yes stop_codon:yes gene_type:complete